MCCTRPSMESDSARRAAPCHPLTLPEPMQWLLDHRESYQLQCTGFGVNMRRGNDEKNWHFGNAASKAAIVLRTVCRSLYRGGSR